MNETVCLPAAAFPGAAAEPSRSSAIARNRSVVVVLGMHRSGTSLLANLLTVLGVDLGQNLLGADVNNQAGYWEQNEIYRTQDDLLQQLGRRWIGPAGTVPFPSEWWRLPELRPFKERLTAIVRAEISKTEGIWGFKDPRTSRLLPLWKEVFAELELEPLYLLSVRDPSTVVESVVKRDEIPASRAELLWLLHNLDAVRDTGDRLRLVVDYDRWFTHPREQAQAIVQALNLSWPDSQEELLAAIRERIRPDLRHCQAPRPLSLPFVAETYEALKQAAVTGRIPGELQRLDEDVRRALALSEPWACVVEELTRPQNLPQFSFVEHFPESRLESLGPTAQAAIWDAQIDGEMHRALFLHPPARLHFRVADGRRARLTFAVNVHPHAWDKPKAGGCEFIVTANGTTYSAVKLDPVNVPSDRRWHECALDIPESSSGAHEVIFETRALGGSLDFRWAVWREPRLTWETVPPLPAVAPGQIDSHSAAPQPMNALTDTPAQAGPISINEVSPPAEVALSLNPNDRDALKVMARVHLNANRHEAARAMCRRVLLENPRDREALDLLAQCRFDFESLDRNESHDDDSGCIVPPLPWFSGRSPAQPAAPAPVRAARASTVSSPSTPARQALQQFSAVGADYFSDVEPPPLTEWHLRNSRVLPNRDHILPFLPKGGICAEVGTQTGSFAKRILSVLQPSRLHVFDLDFTLFDQAHFQSVIQRGTVQLHQGDSATQLASLPDRHFDFIYIDADHSYAGVVRDLEQAARTIKDDGWIVCNDYTVYSPLEGTKYGVCRAVNEFCLLHGYEIVFLALDKWGYHDVAIRKRTTAGSNGARLGTPAGAAATPAPGAAAVPESLAPAESKIHKLARYVGDDWKQQPYYDEAEAHMEQQWQQTVWPFIQEADFSCVLDLAAGHGRNSEKLKQHAGEIYIVDINQENIDFCKNRFTGDPRFTFIRNDGCSLRAIPAGRISLVYCFDAMVHFDSDVVREYLREFARVLRPGGLGFCHHSNFTRNPGGDVHQNPGWRNFMSESLFAHYCAKEGLRVIKSRVINWSAPGSDCVTLFGKP